MRIIAGKHKGRKIELGRQAPHVRPTSDFTREAIFNIVSHGAYVSDEGSPHQGKPVADLCCGSGGFGLEALSRGASHVMFVDMDHHSLLSARQNAERLGESGNVSFLRANVAQLPPAPAPYGLVFLDPPYFGGLIPACLHSLQTGKWINEKSLVVIEHDQRERPDIPASYHQADERRYGRTVVRLLRLQESELL